MSLFKCQKFDKTNELQTLAVDIDILAATETWPENLDSETFLVTILSSIGQTGLTELVAVFY